MWQVRLFKRGVGTLAALFIIFAAGSTAQAVEVATPKMKWQGGQIAAICDGPEDVCFSVELPKYIGNIEGIYPAPIIGDARASWVARSKYELFVCAVVVNSPRVACAKINSDPFPVAYADLRMKYSLSGSTRIAVVGRGVASGSGLLITAEREINRHYADAVVKLKGMIDALTQVGTPYTGRVTIYDPHVHGDPPEEGCKWQTDGWLCPTPKPFDNCIPAQSAKWFCRITADLPEAELDAIE